ncbi:Proteoglycan 4 [Myotis davidii]|uniref:Proteoglycan 4 n=1 Tax=Myotis davidii TaxID=225400 RepID=L5LAE9_MYODS|nr:Proteoglycan 4 [Myotis davidii]
MEWKMLPIHLLLLLSVFLIQQVSSQDVSSCAGRCGEGYSRDTPCNCDYNCQLYMECCPDFKKFCTVELSCKGRCSESFERGRECDCDDQCKKYGKCCPDYDDFCEVHSPTSPPSSKAAPPPAGARQPIKSTTKRSPKPTDKKTSKKVIESEEITEEHSVSENQESSSSSSSSSSSIRKIKSSKNSAANKELKKKPKVKDNKKENPKKKPAPEPPVVDEAGSGLEESDSKPTPTPDSPTTQSTKVTTTSKVTTVTTKPEPTTPKKPEPTTPKKPAPTSPETPPTTSEASTPATTMEPPTPPETDPEGTKSETTTTSKDKTTEKGTHTTTEITTATSTSTTKETATPKEDKTTESQTSTTKQVTSTTTKDTTSAKVTPKETTPAPAVTAATKKTTTTEETTNTSEDTVTTSKVTTAKSPKPTKAPQMPTTTKKPNTTPKVTKPKPTPSPPKTTTSTVPTMNPASSEEDLLQTTTSSDQASNSEMAEEHPKDEDANDAEGEKPSVILRPPVITPLIIPGADFTVRGSDQAIGVNPMLSDETNLCNGRSVDGLTTLANGTLVAFRGHYFWMLNPLSPPSPPRRITEVWGIPSPIDTVFTRCNCDGKTFFFKGSQYWRFTNDVKDPGYPKQIVKGFGGLNGKILAALSIPKYKERPESVYFFKRGGRVQKYTYKQEPNRQCPGRRPALNYPVYGETTQVRRLRFERAIGSHTHTISIQYSRPVRVLYQDKGFLHNEAQTSTLWRGLPSLVTSAISLPNIRKPDGYDYYAFSRDQAYNLNVPSRTARAVTTPSGKTLSNVWYNCP